ncbi:MAG TPA: MFS transporter [bacterium (Candidatus Stahlbacteria)]|nr:MFS transporter [Candidatus Stahlbacteria bacterium]
MRGISRNVLILSFVSLCNDISSEIIYPLLPIFITSVLGASTITLGLIEGIAESTSSLLKLISGYFSDRIHKRKPIVFVGYLVSNLTRPIIGLSGFAYQVGIFRFLDRFGKGVRTAPRDALLSASTDKAHFGQAFGLQRALDHLGAVIGPLIAISLLSAGFSLRRVFLFAAIPGGLVIILFFFVEERFAPVAKRFQVGRINSNFLRFLIVIFIFTLGNSSDAFLILRATTVGIPVGMIPVLWVLLHIVKGISSAPAGALSDRIDRRYVMVMGWLIYASVYWGLAVVRTQFQVLILFLIYGLYFGMTEGVERAFVADLIPEKKRATGYGLYHLAVGISALPASIIFGIFWRFYSPGLAFRFGAGLAFLASLLLLFLVKTKAE